MANIDENERDGDGTLGDDEQEYEEYTAWENPIERLSRQLEPSHERYFRALDAASNAPKWSHMPPQSFADTVSAAQRSVENIQRLHQPLINDFHRDLGAITAGVAPVSWIEKDYAT